MIHNKKKTNYKYTFGPHRGPLPQLRVIRVKHIYSNAKERVHTLLVDFLKIQGMILSYVASLFFAKAITFLTNIIMILFLISLKCSGCGVLVEGVSKCSQDKKKKKKKKQKKQKKKKKKQKKKKKKKKKKKAKKKKKNKKKKKQKQKKKTSKIHK